MATVRALAKLRRTYPRGLSRTGLGDFRRQRDSRLAFDEALGSIGTVEVRAAVDRAIDAVSGVGPEAGVRVLGTFDLSKLRRRDDLELQLSELLGFTEDEYRGHVRLARKGVREVLRHEHPWKVHGSDFLPELLTFARDTYKAERTAGLSRADRRPRAPVMGGRRKAGAIETIDGCIYAVGIIVANADFATGDFSRSYHLGAGVSFTRAPAVSVA